jgi:hypothetical protein
MEDNNPSDECKLIWQRLLEADTEVLRAQNDLFTRCRPTLIDILRAGLYAPNERRTAFRIASLIYDSEQRKPLFPVFLRLACEPTHISEITAARRAILSLPRVWVLERIEIEAGNLLDWDDDWIHRRFPELCRLLDRDLTIRAAQRAATHQNPDIKEAGEDFLNNPNPISPPEEN